MKKKAPAEVITHRIPITDTRPVLHG
jgi:hypothetical protein